MLILPYAPWLPSINPGHVCGWLVVWILVDNVPANNGRLIVFRSESSGQQWKRRLLIPWFRVGWVGSWAIDEKSTGNCFLNELWGFCQKPIFTSTILRMVILVGGAVVGSGIGSGDAIGAPHGRVSCCGNTDLRSHYMSIRSSDCG